MCSFNTIRIGDSNEILGFDRVDSIRFTGGKKMNIRGNKKKKYTKEPKNKRPICSSYLQYSGIGSHIQYVRYVRQALNNLLLNSNQIFHQFFFSSFSFSLSCWAFVLVFVLILVLTPRFRLLLQKPTLEIIA